MCDAAGYQEVCALARAARSVEREYTMLMMIMIMMIMMILIMIMMPEIALAHPMDAGALGRVKSINGFEANLVALWRWDE